MTKYTFIHPTKCGGTSVEKYFSKHYSDYISGCGHLNKCKNNNNPIIIVRDVKSRFLSMFKYWKNGAIDTPYKRTNEFKEKFKSISILDFIYLLKNNKTQLYDRFIREHHFDNTSAWIGNVNFKNIIIIQYDNDLNDKIQSLINYIGIPNKNIYLSKNNVSVDISDEDKLLIDNEYVNKFIEEYFKDDIKLLNTIQNNPHEFKFVI